MTGAIEFLMACQDVCHARINCKGCPIGPACNWECIDLPLDKEYQEIAELVRQVMAESRKKVDEE